MYLCACKKTCMPESFKITKQGKTSNVVDGESESYNTSVTGHLKGTLLNVWRTFKYFHPKDSMFY